MLVGLTVLEEKKIKILWVMEEYQIFDLPYMLLSREAIYKLINYTLISEFVSNASPAFICFNTTWV